MKIKNFLVVLFVLFLCNINAYADKIKVLSVSEKKIRFFNTVVPYVEKVYSDKSTQYRQIEAQLQKGQIPENFEQLKKSYKVKSDEELLRALKPVPKSIAIAQAAMESAWGTSRFYKEANNIFGMWSSASSNNKIAANIKRGGTKTIWLRKYNSLEDSVKSYYYTLSVGKKYKKLRTLNYASNDVYKIIKGLDKYSERGEAYVKEIGSIIRYNKLIHYDQK